MRRASLFYFGLLILAASMFTVALLHSLSRGAWVGTLCGLCFGFRYRLQVMRRVFSPARRYISFIVLSMFLFALLAVLYSSHRWTGAVLARASACTNLNDFSWRYRVAGWVAGLQMIADRPVFGIGWSSDTECQALYLPISVAGLAMKTNDFIVLGATFGLPVLFCFVASVWIVLRNSVQWPSNDAASLTLSGLKAASSGAVTVLLVAFWFDGGLVALPTSVIFWTMLGLGVPQYSQRHPKH